MLTELFNYDAETGLLTWRVSRSNRVRVGQVAGSVRINHANKPYSRKYLGLRVNGKNLFVHRIAHELMTGHAIPPCLQIDHVDGNGLNNRWANLRLATRSQNMGNRTRNRTRRHDLPKGVQWHNRDRLYFARPAGRTIGYFKSLDAAKAAYDAAAAQYYGEFARP